MQAVHAARRFPVILALLAEGRVHLTAVRLLAPHLRDENHLALIGGAIHKSKRDIVAFLAGWFPKADVTTFIRKVADTAVRGMPSPAAMPEGNRVSAAAAPDATGPEDPRGRPPATGEEATDRPVLAPAVSVVQPSRAPAVPSEPARAPRVQPPCSTVTPLSADRYHVRFTASAASIGKLRRAQELLSHAVPTGDVGAIFDRALDALLEKAERQRHSAAARPGHGRPAAAGSRSIPASVEREVWDRDAGQCAFVGAGGHRCEERMFLEFHHVTPWAVGGLPTRENIALRCRAHNAYEAAVYFGPITRARTLDQQT